MEETAYFLDLVTKSTKPIVMTGAMLETSLPNSDGPKNILDAVKVVLACQSQSQNIMVVFNGKIFDARNVTKIHTIDVDAFGTLNDSSFGTIEQKQINCYKNPSEHHIFPIPTSLPKVDIIHAYPDSNGSLIIPIIFHFSFNFNGRFITGDLGLLPTMTFNIAGGVMIGIYLIIVVVYYGRENLSRKLESELPFTKS